MPPMASKVSSITVALSCSERLDRARHYVLLMREVRESAREAVNDASRKPG